MNCSIKVPFKKIHHYNNGLGLSILLCIFYLAGNFMFGLVDAQYEDVRCKCICPVPSVVSNATNGTSNNNRRLYILNVAPNQCNCDFVVLPQLTPDVQNKAKEFCPRCECKYESRDTSIIRFFIIIIIGVISFLVIYMMFLMILDPWIHKRSSRNIYRSFNEEVVLEEHHETPQPQQQPHGQADDDFFASHRTASTSSIIPQPSSSSSPENIPRGVLNRVGHSQNKWKRQVREQRKNIFDDHTILN